MKAEHYETPVVTDRESPSEPLENAARERRAQELLSRVFSVDSYKTSTVDTSSARVLFYAALPFRSGG